MEWKVAQFDLFHKSPKVTTRYLGSFCDRKGWLRKHINICHQSEQNLSKWTNLVALFQNVRKAERRCQLSSIIFSTATRESKFATFKRTKEREEWMHC